MEKERNERERDKNNSCIQKEKKIKFKKCIDRYFQMTLISIVLEWNTEIMLVDWKWGSSHGFFAKLSKTFELKAIM